MRKQGGILAFLAALGAITYTSQTAHPVINGGETPAAISEVNQQSEKELADTFSKFDKLRDYRIDFKSNLPTFAPPEQPDETVSFNWVIATVRDSEHTPLRLDFDREIEAIQLAATEEGYQFERYWFPWRSEFAAAAATSKDAPYVGKFDWSGVTVTRAEDENRGALPGVLLFRWRDINDGTPSLAIFLVSETPVGGNSGLSGIRPLHNRRAVENRRSSLCWHFRNRLAGYAFPCPLFAHRLPQHSPVRGEPGHFVRARVRQL